MKAAFAAIFAAVDVREDYAKIASTSRGTISGARVFLLHDEKAIKQFFYILISVTRTEEILYCLQESCAKIISDIMRRQRMTELEKMIAGKLYDASDRELCEMRVRAHILCKQYSDTNENETERRAKLFDELFPGHKNIAMQGPIFFDYGRFTTFGENFYANYNFTVLDCCPVRIGDNVMCGPNVSLLTPVHPMRWQDRNIRYKEDGTPYDMEYARPITIGNNCWLAGNVTVIGGVTIGDGCVIGAGSVVTKDIPANSFAAGNPCRVIREVTQADAVELKKDLFS